MLCLRVYCSADSDSPDHFSDHEPLEDSASSYINLIHARQQSEMYGISQDVNADNENGDSDDSDFEGDPMCVDIESDVEMFVDSEEVTLIGPVDVSMVTENSGVCLCPFCRLLSYWFSVHDTRIAKFLRSITCEVITSAVMDFSDAILSVRSHRSTTSTTSATVQFIHHACDAMRLDPLSDSTVDLIRELPIHVQALERYNNISVVETKMNHVMLMLAWWNPWNWIHQCFKSFKASLTALDVSSVTSDVSSVTSTHEHWLMRLMRRIYFTLDVDRTSTPLCILHSQDYIQGMPDQIFTYKLPRLQYSSDKRTSTLLNAVTNIVGSWLGFSTTSSSLGKYVIVDLVLKHIGLSGLMLDDIWRLYQNPFRILCEPSPRHRTRFVNEQCLVDFEANLLKHPLSDPSSPERKALLELDTVRMLWEIESKVKANSVSTVRSQPVRSVSQPNIIMPAPTPSSNSLMDVFTDYLDYLFPLVSDQSVISTTFADNRLNKIVEDLDYYLPFRDKAPLRIKSLSGPYHSDNCRTRSGFFSMLCWRGIFYRSKFSYDHHGYFVDPTAFDNYRINSGQPNDYFENKRAYGTSNSLRCLERVPGFWDASNGWENFLAQGPTLDDLYRHLLAIYSIGPLTAFLICGDCYLCGLFSTTVEEVANIVVEIDRGSTRGMCSLGLFGDGATSDQKKSAFIALYHHGLEKYDAAKKERMGYNYFMVEHGTCKLGRFKKVAA